MHTVDTLEYLVAAFVFLVGGALLIWRVGNRLDWAPEAGSLSVMVSLVLFFCAALATKPH
jgi:predicted tellurium resistance membrane protein TerC